MGAIAYATGVTFRVWAKFAASVNVAGDFNGWSATASPLAPDGGSGYWSVDVAGAKAGDEYRFVMPNPADAANPLWHMDPYASSIKTDGANMNAVVAAKDTPYDPGSYSTPAWNQAVIYELHIPTFSGDAGAGTFDTAMVRLPELAALGVNAIEVMPLGQFASLQSTGYNPGYIFAVEDAFGGPDGFRTYVNAAHSLGIAVILDVVYNHLDGLDMWQFDGWYTKGASCSWCGSSVEGGIYFFEDSRAHTPYSHARFDSGRAEVCQYVVDNATRWLQDRFVDGLRFDSIVSIRAIQDERQGYAIVGEVPEGQALLRRINQTVRDSQPWKIMIAEDLQGDARITTSLDDPNGFGFNAQWNNDLSGKVRRAATAPSDDQRQIPALGDALAGMSGASAFTSVIYSENHDQDDPRGGGRLPQIIGNGQADSWFAKKQSTLAAAVILTAPAVPMLFQGQDFLEYRPFPNYGGYPENIDWGRKDTYNGIWTLYRDLIHLRRNWNNNTRGLGGRNIHVLPVTGDNMLVYHRWDQGGQGDDVLVVCNFASQKYPSYAIGAPQPGMWRVRLNSDAHDYDGYFDGWAAIDTEANGPALNGMPYSANLSIGAYTCVILSQG